MIPPVFDPNDPSTPGRIGLPKKRKRVWNIIRTIAILLMIAGGLLLLWVVTQIALSV